MMYVLEFLIYHLRPFGIDTVVQSERHISETERAEKPKSIDIQPNSSKIPVKSKKSVWSSLYEEKSPHRDLSTNGLKTKVTEMLGNLKGKKN